MFHLTPVRFHVLLPLSQRQSSSNAAKLSHLSSQEVLRAPASAVIVVREREINKTQPAATSGIFRSFHNNPAGTPFSPQTGGEDSRIKALCFHFILKIRSRLIHIFVFCLSGKDLNTHSNVHEEGPVGFCFVPPDVHRTRKQALCGS